MTRLKVIPGEVGERIRAVTQARWVRFQRTSCAFFSDVQRVKKMAKVANSTDSSSLAEVVDRILDKGIVIDAWLKVSLVGIELLAVEARIVIASVETYLKYAEAIGLTAPAAAPA
jgi:hypothetical protein